MSPAFEPPRPPGASVADEELRQAALRQDASAVERWSARASPQALRCALMGLCHASRSDLALRLLRSAPAEWPGRQAAIAEALAFCQERGKRSAFCSLLACVTEFDPRLHGPLALRARKAFPEAPFWSQALAERFGEAAILAPTRSAAIQAGRRERRGALRRLMSALSQDPGGRSRAPPAGPYPLVERRRPAAT